jgi:hypothetical protein
MTEKAVKMDRIHNKLAEAPQGQQEWSALIHFTLIVLRRIEVTINHNHENVDNCC